MIAIYKKNTSLSASHQLAMKKATTYSSAGPPCGEPFSYKKVSMWLAKLFEATFRNVADAATNLASATVTGMRTRPGITSTAIGSAGLLGGLVIYLVVRGFKRAISGFMMIAVGFLLATGSVGLMLVQFVPSVVTIVNATSVAAVATQNSTSSIVYK